jgi:hypothetical protein
MSLNAPLVEASEGRANLTTNSRSKKWPRMNADKTRIRQFFKSDLRFIRVYPRLIPSSFPLLHGINSPA